MGEYGPELAHRNWGVVGTGEAGSRIASHYFASHRNPAVGDRVLLLNTSQPDLISIFDSLEDRIGRAARDRLDEANVCTFSDEGGAGAWFLEGERIIQEEKNWEEIAPRFTNVFGGAGTSRVILHILGLGGGTGNGCTPQIIRNLKNGDVQHVRSDVFQFAVGIWPFPDEERHRQVNAVMGLSRLLRYGDDGETNSDLVLLMGNEQLDRIGRSDRVDTDGAWHPLNRIVVEVLDAMISPSRGANQVIDAKDYAVNARRYNVQHFTAGLAWDAPLYTDLEVLLDEAKRNMLIPINPETSLLTYLVLSVPPDAMDDPKFSPKTVSSSVGTWMESEGIDPIQGMESVVPDRGLSNSYRAILCLGGFDLFPLLDQHEDDVEKEIQTQDRIGGREEARKVQQAWDRIREYAEDANDIRRIHQS